jgi:hypothetical protein
MTMHFLAALLEQHQTELDVQFRRMAAIQAELDLLKAALRPAQPMAPAFFRERRAALIGRAERRVYTVRANGGRV